MHFGAHKFSWDGLPTIIPRRNVQIGQRRSLTATDWKHVKKAYYEALEVQSLGKHNTIETQLCPPPNTMLALGK